jgi:crotonobetaine/carnitine-CoA ligase
VDRKKDIIRRKGENISSVELETVINTNPKVSESAVIGVPSSLSEDEVKAFVVLKDGEYLSPEKLIEWCMDKLADFKIPRFVEYRKNLPRTPSQRIAKYILKKENIGKETWDMSAYIKNR